MDGSRSSVLMAVVQACIADATYARAQEDWSKMHPSRLNQKPDDRFQVIVQCAACGKHDWWPATMEGPYGDKPYINNYYCKNAVLCLEYRENGVFQVTNALWCVPGEHAFPEDQPGATTMVRRVQIKGQFGTQSVDKAASVCSAHAVVLGLNMEADPDEEEEAARATRIATGRGMPFIGRRAKALENDKKAGEARAKDYDPNYTKALEYMTDNPDWEPPWAEK